MLKLGRFTKVKVLFLVLVFVFNFDLFKFSAAILEKGLLRTLNVVPHSQSLFFSLGICSTDIVIVIFFGQFCPKGKVAMRLTEQKQATPWLFHATACSVCRCTESKSM